MRDVIFSRVPRIAYFPTFVFDFPQKIYLTENRTGAVNRFYRQLFQDILDYDGQGLSIEDNIVRRVRGEGLITAWTDFLSIWNGREDRGKIDHVVDRAGDIVTKVVFGRWNKIFKDDAHGKQLLISYEIEEGEITDSKGAKVKSPEHDIYIKMQIKDGTRRFDVNSRSLGFRWFFAFMLFTQFRTVRQDSPPVLFLFDEPASNLHSAAQQKLIDSFPEIAKNGHMLAYTTHSHYMIEPKWLEQTFIVINGSDRPADSILDTVSLDDESLDIQAHSYRSFVDKNPSNTSYFQPIIDRLEVTPSQFDIKRDSIIVEGRSDFYILRYAAELLKKEHLPLMPGGGATTLGALIALHVGWNLNMLFLLDGDREGEKARGRYISDLSIKEDRVVCLSSMISGVHEIEDTLDGSALKIIQSALKLKSTPNKGQIKLFFQEHLASGNIIDLGDNFREKMSSLLDQLEALLRA